MEVKNTSTESQTSLRIHHSKVIPGEKRKVAALSVSFNISPKKSDESNTNIQSINDLIINELSSCIAAFGGSFSKVSSNQILGLFGAGSSAEHSCRRTIDCCFYLFSSIESMGSKIDSDNQPVILNATAGIAYDTAIVTPDSKGGFSVKGSCIDESCELMKESKSDSFIVSSAAMLSCSDFFEWDQIILNNRNKAWQPKKKENSLLTNPLLYKVPLFGREKQMQKLQTAFASYLTWFNSPPVFISGKPGSGKTQLIEQFLTKLSEGNVKVIRLKNKLWDQSPLGTWLPLMKKGIFDPYSNILAEIKRIKQNDNLILFIDDLQWADVASLKLLDQMSHVITDTGIFLIIASRNPARGFLFDSADKIEIHGLSKTSTLSLIESILGSSEQGEDIRLADYLLEKTDGNPLLMIELIVYASEAGILGRNSQYLWFLNKKLVHKVSDTSDSSLQARISILKPQEKFALQLASVLGNGFSEVLFFDVFTGLGKEKARVLLARLLNLGFLSFQKDNTFCFLNSLIAETIYNSILKENKIIMHRQAMKVLATNQNPLDFTNLSITISRHCIESNSGKDAVPWLLDAMELCITAADASQAEQLSIEVLKRLSKDSEFSTRAKYLEIRLYSLLGKFQLALDTGLEMEKTFQGKQLALTYFIIAQAKENLGMPLLDVLEYYMQSAKTAEKAGDSNTLANSLGAAGAVNVALGKKDSALAVLNKALMYEDSVDARSCARLHGNLGILLQRTGSLADALMHYKKTYEMGKNCGDSGIEANALAYMGHVEINMGNRISGMNKYREALSIHRKTGNIRGECITLGNLGGALARYGEAANAIEALNRAIKLAEDIGHTRGVMTFHGNLGLAYKLAGDYNMAQQHILESLNMIKKTGDKRSLSICYLNLAGVLSKKNQINDAIIEARRALRFSCTVNALLTQGRALTTLGWLMLKTDRTSLALSFFNESYKRLSFAGDHSTLAAPVIGLCNCLVLLNREKEAKEKFEEVMELKQKYDIDLESEVDLKELKTMLGITNE